MRKKVEGNVWNAYSRMLSIVWNIFRSVGSVLKRLYFTSFDPRSLTKRFLRGDTGNMFILNRKGHHLSPSCKTRGAIVYQSLHA